MATILAHLQVRPGEEARFEALARRLYAASHEGEPGLRRYEYWRGAQPGTYYTLLAFDDYPGFLAHQSSEHHEAASAELGQVLAGIRLEWVDPVGGASPLLPTEGGEAPPGSGPVAERYARRMPAEVAAWWLALRDADDQG